MMFHREILLCIYDMHFILQKTERRKKDKWDFSGEKFAIIMRVRQKAYRMYRIRGSGA
ncbi:MAG: hypothetical protein Q4C73_08000 [Eubacteriales bacterium]|nr:hypothetical protein [Eubacteriales bacterium]